VFGTSAASEALMLDNLIGRKWSSARCDSQWYPKLELRWQHPGVLCAKHMLRERQTTLLYRISWRTLLREMSLLLDRADNGDNAAIICAKMESDFRRSASSYSWVAKWSRGLRRSDDIFQRSERSGRPEDQFTSLRVVNSLNWSPFPSLPQIPTATKIPRSA
jgi:hypothetical protein